MMYTRLYFVCLIVGVLGFWAYLFFRAPSLSVLDMRCGSFQKYINGQYEYPDLTVEQAIKCKRIDEITSKEYSDERPDRLLELKEDLDAWEE